MKKVSLSVCLILMVISAFVAFQITYTYQTAKYESTIYGLSKWQQMEADLDTVEAVMGEDNAAWQETYKTLAEIDAYTRANYVGDIDEDNLRDYVLTGYVYGTGDKYSAYMNKEEYDAYLLSTREGSTVGIGLRIVYDNTIGGIYVTSVVPDSPAAEAGIMPGDVIVKVEDKIVNEFGYYNSYNLIKNGEEGEECHVTLATALSDYAETKEITMARAIVKHETVSTRMLNDDTAYVHITEFNATTGEEFRNAMDSLIEQGAQKYVFDVRDNPGGNVIGVSEVLDYLLPEGPIIRCISKTGEESVLNSDAASLDAPMAVLVNGSTASGGELFTAALRDYGKATIVGTTTYGKGTMQTIVPLTNGGGLKISTQMYNPPYGDNYENIGVEPDIVVELSPEDAAIRYKLTDEEDVQLQAALDTLGPHE